MDIQRINNLLSIFKRIGLQNNWNVLPFPNYQITSIRNDLTIIARLMFASMLMYKIDEAVIYSGLIE